MSWFDHLPDWEARQALEVIGDAMEDLEFKHLHPSGETEECNIQERVGIIVRRYEKAEAENRKLSRWLKTSWERINCPECGSLCVFGKGFEEHADGCEFAAWLGSRDRKEVRDA